MTLEELKKKYKNVIDKDLALMTDKEFAKYIEYLNEKNKLEEKKDEEN